MKILYVHIGTPKTGTTSIQKFLCKNRNVLEKYGYCYPDFQDLVPGYSAHINGRFLVQTSMVKSKKDRIGQRTYRVGMDRVINLFETYDNVILSCESIYRATYSRRSSLWQELKEEGEKHGFSVKIIIYLRRQDLYMVSYYNQKVKMNIRADGRVGQKTWEEFMEPPIPEERSLNYYERLERIRVVLGREAIIVRRFDKNHFYGGSLYSEFLHLIGLEYTEEYQVDKEECNQSLMGNTVEIMRLLNEVEELNSEDRSFFKKALYADGPISAKYYKTSMFSKKEAEEFLTEYETENQKIAEEYIGDGQPLFDNTIEDLPKYNHRNEYMIDDVIRFTALCMKQLLNENRKLEKEIINLKSDDTPRRSPMEKVKVLKRFL